MSGDYFQIFTKDCLKEEEKKEREINRNKLIKDKSWNKNETRRKQIFQCLDMGMKLVDIKKKYKIPQKLITATKKMYKEIKNKQMEQEEQNDIDELINKIENERRQKDKKNTSEKENTITKIHNVSSVPTDNISISKLSKKELSELVRERGGKVC